MDWWIGLTTLEQMFLVVGIGCFLILLAKLIMVIVQFYKFDNLNAERQEIENYDQIANEDSDVEKQQPRFFSLISINLLILIFTLSYLLLNNIIKSSWVFAVCGAISLLVFFVFSYAKLFLFKKREK
jgi:hypothetical protein